MRKAHGVLAIIGVPSPFAHEPDPDEEREQGNDDHEEDTLDVIYRALRDGDESMMRATMQIAHCLAGMAKSAHPGDDEGLKRWYHQCREVLDNMSDDGENDHE